MKGVKKINLRLKQEILKMVEEDQEMRKNDKWDSCVDKRNTNQMKFIIRKYGWPGKNLVGERGADGAWLLVQHADHDIKFQKKCLQLIREAVKKGDAKKSYLAYLKDRIWVHEKKKQFYGTQFHLQKKSNTLSHYPIYDIKNIDKRRKGIGLESFRKYKKMIDKSFKYFLRGNS